MLATSSLNKPILVAITGGIGSGKTTVLQCFMDLGVPCFCADKVAGAYYEKSDFCNSVAQLLGANIFTNGIVDKKKIAQIVFNDKLKLKQLNNLVHPLVLNDFKNWTNQHYNKPYLLFESAILFENKLQHNFDKVICVTAPIDVRIRRIIKRDKVSKLETENRIKNQLSDTFKCENSDFVINNCRGEKYRKQRVLSIDKQLLKLKNKQY